MNKTTLMAIGERKAVIAGLTILGILGLGLVPVALLIDHSLPAAAIIGFVSVVTIVASGCAFGSLHNDEAKIFGVRMWTK